MADEKVKDPGETPGAIETPEVPEELKGKTSDELVKLYQQKDMEAKKKEAILQDRYNNLETLLGRQGEELGQLRKKADGDGKGDRTDIDKIREDLEASGIDMKGIEKIVDFHTSSLVKQISVLQGVVQAQILISEIPELKDIELQKKVLDRLAEKNLPPTEWTIKQVYAEIKGQTEPNIRADERKKVLEELDQKKRLLPEGGGGGRAEKGRDLGQEIVDAGKGRKI